jgi:hypothetical protein
MVIVPNPGMFFFCPAQIYQPPRPSVQLPSISMIMPTGKKVRSSMSLASNRSPLAILVANVLVMMPSLFLFTYSHIYH